MADPSPTRIDPAEPARSCPTCGRRLPAVDAIKRNRFVRGLWLAWLPSLPLLVAIGVALREMSRQKATGLVAAIGGLTKGYVAAGLVLTLACAITAIVFLPRSFSRGHWVRAVFSVISMLWCAAVILLLGACAWLAFVFLRP